MDRQVFWQAKYIRW